MKPQPSLNFYCKRCKKLQQSISYFFTKSEPQTPKMWCKFCGRILKPINDGLDIITSYINSDGDDISGDGINEIKEIIKKHLGADLLPEEKK